MSQRGAPSALTVTLLFVLLCLIWSSTWLVIKVGLQDLPVFTSAALRFLLAGALMAAMARPLQRLEGGTAPPAWLWLTLGTLNFATSYGLLYHCEQLGLLPSISCLLWAVFPLLMALAGRLFLGEVLHLRHALGFLLSFAGVVFLFLTDLSHMGQGTVPLALLLLVSPLVSAVGTTLLKRWGSGCSSVLINRNAMLTGAVLLGAVAWWRDTDAAVVLSGRALFSLGYLAVCGTFVSFGIYHWLLRWAPASRMSLIAVITPVLAQLLDWAFGLLQPTWTLAAGTGMVLLGVVMVIRRRR